MDEYNATTIAQVTITVDISASCISILAVIVGPEWATKAPISIKLIHWMPIDHKYSKFS